MRRKIIAIAFFLCLIGGVATWHASDYRAAANTELAFFEDDIRSFEEADKLHAPKFDGIVFVGSSSIRFWKTLIKDMAPLPVINRGFGGSELSHVIFNAHRIIIPYKPKAVVLYAGDNDLADGTDKTPEDILADYKRFVQTIREPLPNTELYFLSIKPSPWRWSQWPVMAKANALIRSWSRHHAHLHYIDGANVLLDTDGHPRDDLFWFDGLHLNEKGYAAWSQIIRKVLTADFMEHASQ
jgi:hypothetical protein